MRILRWIAAFPLAIMLGYLAYLVGGAINNFCTIMYFDAPLHGWVKASTDALNNTYLGATLVYSAVRIAPSAPKVVALSASGLVTFIVGVSLLASFEINKFYALPAMCGVLFGGFAVLYATMIDEVRPYGTFETDGEN